MKHFYILAAVAFVMLSCMAAQPSKSLQSRLFGSWTAASGDETIVFKFDKDSMYYLDDFPIVSIPYKFAGDSITLDYYGETEVSHISFHKDTLVMKNQYGVVNCYVPVK